MRKDGRSYGFVAAVAIVLWQAGCAQLATIEGTKVAFPDDPSTSKTHCYVGCLNTACSAGIPLSTIIGQVVFEIYGWFTGAPGANWDDMVQDTKAAVHGSLSVWKAGFSKQGCYDECNKCLKK